MLTLGFLNFGRTTHVGPRFIYFEEGAEFAYGADDPVLAECLELLHTFEGRDCGQWYPVVVIRGVETPHESEGRLEDLWERRQGLVLVERQISIRKVEFDCKMDQTILRGEEEDDGPCLTALTAFASSDSSMTASSEAEGTDSRARASSTVVAIYFIFIWWKKDRGAPEDVMSST